MQKGGDIIIRPGRPRPFRPRPFPPRRGPIIQLTGTAGIIFSVSIVVIILGVIIVAVIFGRRERYKNNDRD